MTEELRQGVLGDAVECVAKVWGRIVKNHLDITYEPKSA